MSNINLTIDSLNYKIHKNTILNNVSFELNGFQAVSILGPNAAGKSTLLKALAAQLMPQSGSIVFNGINVENQRLEYLSQLGYMPEKAVVLAELTVIEQLKLCASITNVTKGELDIQKVINTCQLKKVLNTRTHHLSLGYRQRLNLAQALLNQPPLLILDEPLNGLDPHLIIEFRNLIQHLKKRTLVIMSTHYLAQAEIISDRILIMQNGQLLDNIEMREKAQTSDLESIYMQHMVKFQEQDVNS